MKHRIKEIAKRKGVTQAILAQRMGVSLYYVKHIYLRENLSLTTLQSVAKALQCEVWQLIATEYEVLKTGEGDVLTPDGKRVPLKSLRYCFDSKS